MRWSVGCEYDGRGPDAEGDQGPCPGDGEGEKRMDTAGRSPRLDTRHPPPWELRGDSGGRKIVVSETEQRRAPYLAVRL